MNTNKIKAIISLEQVLSEMYGLYVKKRMDCPIHGGDNCFTIKENYFKCHSCGANGDIFAFIMAMEKIDFKEARKQILEHFRLENMTDDEIKYKSSIKAVQKREKNRNFSEWQKQADNFHNARKENLLKYAQPFLISRNITLGTALTCLSWNCKDEYFASSQWGINDGSKLKVPQGLLICSMRENEIIGLTVRTKDNKNKYWQVKGSQSKPFFIGNSKDIVFIMESALDCLLLFQESYKVGIKISCVGLRGATGQFDKELINFIEQAKQIFYIPDKDKAGLEAIPDKMKLFPNCRVVLTGKSKDLGELAQKYGNSHIVADWLCNTLKIENQSFSCEICTYWTNKRKIEYLPCECSYTKQVTVQDWICPFFKIKNEV